MSIQLNTDTDSTVVLNLNTKDETGKDRTARMFYQLAEYESKEAFLGSVKEDVELAVAEFGGDGESSYTFSDIPENLTLMNLADHERIEAQIWEILELSEEDIDMLAAWVSMKKPETAAFCEIDVKETLDMAKESFGGIHSTRPDWAYEQLEQMGVMDNLPPIIENNLDIDSIGSELMRRGNVKMVETNAGCFYFNGV